MRLGQQDPSSGLRVALGADHSVRQHRIDRRAAPGYIGLEGSGAALADTDPGLAAMQVLSGAQALRQIIQAWVPPTEQASNEAVVAKLRARLGPKAFAAAWAVGQSRSLAEWKASLLAQSP